MQIETSNSSIKLAESSGIVQAKHVIRLPNLPEETRSLLTEADTDPKLISKINFTDHGGTVLTNVQVQLIFWGREWDSNPPPSPTVSEITKAIATILSSSYMSELSQYRSISSGSLLESKVVTTSEPPNSFKNHDVAHMVQGLIDTGTVVSPLSNNQILYFVIMPINAKSDKSFVGEHTFFKYKNKKNSQSANVHFAWVTNNGQLDFITTVFSHELVESCTDPEGTAFLGTAGTCSQSGWCEIADVCTNTGKVNGVTVQSYWSQRSSTCVIPSTDIPS